MGLDKGKLFSSMSVEFWGLNGHPRNRVVDIYIPMISVFLLLVFLRIISIKINWHGVNEGLRCCVCAVKCCMFNIMEPPTQ